MNVRVPLVLEHDHGPDLRIARKEHPEACHHDVEIAVTIQVRGLRMCRRENRVPDGGFRKSPARRLSNPDYAMLQQVAGNHIQQAIVVEVNWLHVGDLRALGCREGRADSLG